MKANLFYLILFLFGLSSCVADDFDLHDPFPEDDNELPVDFTFLLPGEEEPGGRSIENPKTKFNEGDIIHIVGTFKAIYNNDQEVVVVRYGALRKVKNGWDTVPGNKMKWPNMATTGSFQAYWISGSTGLLNVNESLEMNLSDVTPTTDPLMATSEPDISYGRGVRMQFEHLCSYLTLTALEPMVSDTYWIAPDPNSQTPIYNGFKLTLEETNTLNFEFIEIPNDDYGGLVYVAGQAFNYEDSSNGVLTTNTYANFFLAPGTYNQFSIRYPGLPPYSYEFLKYDFENIQPGAAGDNIPNVVPELKAGNTYVLNVTKSPGITIVAPPSAEGWDESGAFYDVDVEEFLRAATDAEGQDYYNDTGTQILQKTSTGVKLLHNITFNYAPYNGVFDNFEANINEGQIFDGDYHYIAGIASPVFRYNYGTIKNLGLKQIKGVLVTDKNDDSGHDMSRQGLICQWNRGGTLQNIRLPEGGTITGMVKQTVGSDNENHDIGIVTGTNTGTIDGLELGGTFNFTLSGYYEEGGTPMAVNVTVNFGGICGQNNNMISNVDSPDNNLNLKLVNNCQGVTGALYTGGLAGYSSGGFSDIVLQTVNVDCSQSKGQNLYSGGMAGELTSTDTGSTMVGVDNCIVGGAVKAGEANYYAGNHTDSSNLTGGLSGTLSNTTVTGFRVSMDIQGPLTDSDDVLDGTGGVFGRIRSQSPMSNIIAYGPALSGAGYLGNFAGIVPAGMTWDDYAAMGIVVRQFVDVNIGSDEVLINE